MPKLQETAALGNRCATIMESLTWTACSAARAALHRRLTFHVAPREQLAGDGLVIVGLLSAADKLSRSGNGK